MLKTKPNPGTKIRCVNTAGYEFLTKGGIYTVVEVTDNLETCFAYVDDDGDTILHEIGFDTEEFDFVEGDEMQVSNNITNAGLQVSNNPLDSETNTKDETPDEFKVEDVVWCILHGKGGGYLHP